MSLWLIEVKSQSHRPGGQLVTSDNIWFVWLARLVIEKIVRHQNKGCLSKCVGCSSPTGQGIHVSLLIEGFQSLGLCDWSLTKYILTLYNEIYTVQYGQFVSLCQFQIRSWSSLLFSMLCKSIHSSLRNWDTTSVPVKVSSLAVCWTTHYLKSSYSPLMQQQ